MGKGCWVGCWGIRLGPRSPAVVGASVDSRPLPTDGSRSNDASSASSPVFSVLPSRPLNDMSSGLPTASAETSCSLLQTTTSSDDTPASNHAAGLLARVSVPRTDPCVPFPAAHGAPSARCRCRPPSGATPPTDEALTSTSSSGGSLRANMLETLRPLKLVWKAEEDHE